MMEIINLINDLLWTYILVARCWDAPYGLR